MPPEKILNICKAHEKEGVDRFSIVTSGRVLDGQEFERAIKSVELMRAQCDIKLCASMGFLSGEQLQRLRDAGVTTYHHNIETSPSNFHNICTTHSIEQKLSTLKTIKKKGLRVCSGGIIGLGESWQDRIEMATTLAEYHVDSIPINALIPIPGTPLQDLPRLSENEILRTVAIFRYVNPTAHIRLAAGRALMTDDGKRAFNAGANATITGNMLTTVACATIQSDRTMLKELGRRVKKHPNETTT